jgi:methyltransferase (TIGR00027 family)
MADSAVSRTALATSLMRAAHTRMDPNPLIDDPWGDRLVPDSARDMFRKAALARMDDAARAVAMASPDTIVDDSLRRSRAYANVITRTRFAEDALRDAVAKGIRQYVLIGAGFDSFALRRPAFSVDLQIFEIDSPATQNLKLERIRECGVALPESVHFVAADLSRETVAAALSRSAFRSSDLTFFSWLGVTMYLTREANLATLRSIAACSAAGSEMVFTYFDQRLLEVQSEAFLDMQERVAALGEPFLSGFDPATLRLVLEQCGLEVLEDLIGSDVAAKYRRTGNDALGESSYSHIVRARIIEGSAWMPSPERVEAYRRDEG